MGGEGYCELLDGPVSSALFCDPTDVALDKFGNVFISDGYNHQIRKISNGEVMGLGGTWYNPGFADGEGTAVRFNSPYGVAVNNGVVYVADRYNQRIRRITLTCPPSDTVANITTAKCDCIGAGYLPLYSGQYVSSCAYCPLGYFLNQTSATCQKCSFGQYRSAGMLNCVNCPAGLVPSADSASCSECRAPFTCPSYASCNSTAIVACQFGYRISTNRTVCEQCPIGYQSSADYLSCVLCAAGSTFRSSLAHDSCLQCPVNSVCAYIGFACYAGYEPTGNGTGCQICQSGYSIISNHRLVTLHVYHAPLAPSLLLTDNLAMHVVLENIGQTHRLTCVFHVLKMEQRP